MKRKNRKKMKKQFQKSNILKQKQKGKEVEGRESHKRMNEDKYT